MLLLRGKHILLRNGGSYSSKVLQLVATRGMLGGSTITGGNQHMTRQRVLVCYDTSEVQLVFAGERGAAALPSGITVKASIEYLGTRYQVTFNGGSTSATIANNALAVSDKIPGLIIPAGSYVNLYVYATVASGTSMYLLQYLNGSEGDGIEVGTSITDKTMSGTVTDAGTGASAARGYTASAVIGKVATNSKAVMVWGDSISIGTGDDNQIGYLGLAFQRHQIPYMRVGQGGSTGNAGLTLIGSDAQIPACVQYVTDASWEYGVNDFSSGTSAASVRTTATSFATAWLALKPNSKISISTVLPVVNPTNTAVQSAVDGSYWNATREAQRVAYNNALRAGLPTGFTYLWEAAGDATGASGLFKGIERSKDEGLWRQDYANQNGFSAINDGLHPGRSLQTCCAAALDIQAFLGVSPKWGPEISYITIPSSGLYAQAQLYPSNYAVAETPGTLTGITVSQGGGAAENCIYMTKTASDQIRLYLYNRFVASSTKVFTVAATNNLVDTSGAISPARTVINTNVANSSTWNGSSDPGTVISSDDFARSDTAYDAAAQNHTIGANWTDYPGNGAKIASNTLKIQGNNGRQVFWNAATYTNIAAEIEFDPADSTASSSTPFDFKLGVRMNAATNKGVFARINRQADLNGYTRLEIQNDKTGNAFAAAGGNVAIPSNLPNGTRYKLRISANGTGSTKTMTATLSNVSTGAVLATLTASANQTTFPDTAGYCGVVSATTATNDASVAVASEVVLDNFAIRQLTDATAPVIASAALSSSRLYVSVGLTELGLPLLPTSGATGFSVLVDGVAQTISETKIFGADQCRVVLASAAPSGTVTLNYAPGTITDQSSNQVTTTTGFAVS